jgi:hypothetical protein
MPRRTETLYARSGDLAIAYQRQKQCDAGCGLAVTGNDPAAMPRCPFLRYSAAVRLPIGLPSRSAPPPPPHGHAAESEQEGDGRQHAAGRQCRRPPGWIKSALPGVARIVTGLPRRAERFGATGIVDAIA